MDIFCIRIGNKYGIEYEEYLNSKLSNHNVTWIREPFSDTFPLQWNKVHFMSLDRDTPICVLDIDILLLGEYEELLNFPINRGQFISIPSWWSGNPNYSLNGGFYKYYPKDCKYIYNIYMEDPAYWQSYYIKNKTTKGPINGEQYFVEDRVKKQLELKLVPESWVARWVTEKTASFDLSLSSLKEQKEKIELQLNLEYMKRTGNEYLFLGNSFHSDIKLVHFTNSINKPNEWDLYSYYTNK